MAAWNSDSPLQNGFLSTVVNSIGPEARLPWVPIIPLLTSCVIWKLLYVSVLDPSSVKQG